MRYPPQIRASRKALGKIAFFRETLKICWPNTNELFVVERLIVTKGKQI